MSSTTAIELTAAEFDRLFAQYRVRFVMIASALVHDEALAEDLVTDSFVYFWEHRDQIVVESCYESYILGIVKNKCLMALRSQLAEKRKQQNIYSLAQWEVRQGIDVLEDCALSKEIFSKEVADIFRRELSKMPELTRKVFEASRLEAKTYQEIAGEYDISVRKVTSEMQLALGMLRESLRDYLPLMLAMYCWVKK